MKERVLQVVIVSIRVRDISSNKWNWLEWRYIDGFLLRDFLDVIGCFY